MAMFIRVLARTTGVLVSMLQFGCIAHCTLEFVGDFILCSGSSMMPTIVDNDVVLTEHLSITKRSLQKGDVVICRSPNNPHILICKRLIGMEGDHVFKGQTQTFQRIPLGHVWLEGDNKDQSTDSRDYGPVPYGLIRSRVFYKLWPTKTMGSVSLPHVDSS